MEDNYVSNNISLKVSITIGKVSGLGKINLRILNFQLRGNPKYSWETKMKDKHKSHQTL